MLTATIGLFFMVSSLAPAGVGVYLYLRSARLRRDGVQTHGIVVDIRRDGKYSHPVFEFTDRAGKKHQVPSSIGSTGGYVKGDSVRVLYNPENPAEARIDTFVSMWLAVCVCLAAGVGDFVTGLIIILCL